MAKITLQPGEALEVNFEGCTTEAITVAFAPGDLRILTGCQSDVAKKLLDVKPSTLNRIVIGRHHPKETLTRENGVEIIHDRKVF